MDTVVIGVTRGGVPVAAEVARELGAPLDICVVRKLVVLRDVPVTIGAITEGGTTYFDPELLSRFNVSSRELGEAIGRESVEVTRLSHLLRSSPPIDVYGRDVILIDEGVIAGQTMRAAALSLTARGVHMLELATPVAAVQVLDELRPDFDHVTCLEAEPNLVAIGARYRELWSVSDAEIVDLLEAAPLSLRGVAI